jgi:outer membrane receptor protein involved in Fe transport
MGLVLTSGASMAQKDVGDAEMTADSSQVIEEVIVIGSRLIRPNLSSPSPVVSFDAAEIEISGTTNMEDIVNTLPQVIPSADRTSNNPGNGMSVVDLRGMGPNRALVMLNGRRFAPSGVYGAVDVNNIPAALVERVDVVSGGASAVYGSDAVVGVIDFVLKDHFEGQELNAHYDTTHAGDGEVFDVSLSAGTVLAGGRGQLTGFLNYHQRDPILQGDREFTRSFITDNPFDGTGETQVRGSLVAPQGVLAFIPTVLNGQLFDPTIFNPDGTLRPMQRPEDDYNFAPDNFLQVPLERKVAAAFLNYDFSPQLQGTIELLFARNESRRQLAPVPASGFFDISIDSPFLPEETQEALRNSFDPDGDGIATPFLLRRMQESGQRISDSSRDTLRLVAGLDGEFSHDWTWEAYYSFSDTDLDPKNLNDVSRTRLQQALLIDPATGGCLDPSNGCVPANIFGAGNLSEEAVDFIRFPSVESDEQVEEQIVSAAISGQFMDLPAGRISLATGLEWRQRFSCHCWTENPMRNIWGWKPAGGFRSTTRQVRWRPGNWVPSGCRRIAFACGRCSSMRSGHPIFSRSSKHPKCAKRRILRDRMIFAVRHETPSAMGCPRSVLPRASNPACLVSLNRPSSIS